MLPSEAFQVLGVEARFDLSSRDLRAAWMRRASVAHPDAAGAVDESARVNDAMRVLSDPIQRAQALLELRGAPEVEARSLPQGFLLEMMELRERADECAGDAVATARLRDEAASRRDAAVAEIAAIFAGSGAGSIAPEHSGQVAEQINIVRAFERMLEQLDREAGHGSPSP
jgi:molecular chaperone HscB